MKNIFYISLFVLLLIVTCLIFLFSCIVTMSDGQGALIFIFSIPAMAVLLVLSLLLARTIEKTKRIGFHLKKISLAFAALLALFFVFSFIPVLNKIPNYFLQFIGSTFKTVTGKTPYAYVRERKSFENLLSKEIVELNKKNIDFSTLDVSFAWDKVCIFGPYTNNAKARSVLNLDWNIEERSEIYHSDSINALVFLFEGKVNHVVNLKRGIADFKELDLCLLRNQTQFLLEVSPNGLKILRRN